LIQEYEVNIVVQVNGKKRGLIKCKRDIDEKNIFEMIKKEKNIYKHIEGKEMRKKIFVKNKLINLIV
jgi:leucyl-tRNA synthetase